MSGEQIVYLKEMKWSAREWWDGLLVTGKEMVCLSVTKRWLVCEWCGDGLWASGEFVSDEMVCELWEHSLWVVKIWFPSGENMVCERWLHGLWVVRWFVCEWREDRSFVTFEEMVFCVMWCFVNVEKMVCLWVVQCFFVWWVDCEWWDGLFQTGMGEEMVCDWWDVLWVIRREFVSDEMVCEGWGYCLQVVSICCLWVVMR